jgi:hypothetical protein
MRSEVEIQKTDKDSGVVLYKDQKSRKEYCRLHLRPTKILPVTLRVVVLHTTILLGYRNGKETAGQGRAGQGRAGVISLEWIMDQEH